MRDTTTPLVIPANAGIRASTFTTPANAGFRIKSVMTASCNASPELNHAHRHTLTPAHLLDPGFELTLRPMRYPQFYEMYRDAIRNTWTVREEINFQIDISDLHDKMTPADRHVIHRLVAFFATGDSIVSNNLVLNLYQHLNAPRSTHVPVTSVVRRSAACAVI